MSALRRAVMTVACVLAAGGLNACASGPQAPVWLSDAQASLERFQDASLSADDRVARAEFVRARSSLASAGDTVRVARAELVRCAVQIASLDFAPCAGFDALRADAAEPERAYADYLAGLPLTPERAALLPADQRKALAEMGGQPSNAAAGRFTSIADPLARLVAAGVAVRTGRATPATLEAAAETAAAQGWRRPLLAWLGAQATQAEAAGDTAAAQRLRRRMDLVSGR